LEYGKCVTRISDKKGKKGGGKRGGEKIVRRVCWGPIAGTVHENALVGLFCLAEQTERNSSAGEGTRGEKKKMDDTGKKN